MKKQYPTYLIVGAVEWIIPYINGYEKTTTKIDKKGNEKTKTTIKSPSSTIQLAGCGGCVRTLFKLNQIDWLDFTISEVKTALTHKGNANKNEIISAVGMQYKILCKTDHEADAISIATAAYFELKKIIRSEKLNAR